MEAFIPDDALKAATKAVEELSLGVAGANSEAIARAALEAAVSRIAEVAWDEGVIYGHNNEGRLIDKRAENPFEEAR